MADELEYTLQERRSIVTNDIIKGELLTDQSLAAKLHDLEPFLSRKVTERLKKVSSKAAAADVDDVPQIGQPPSISTATLRDYQLRGVMPIDTETCLLHLCLSVTHHILIHSMSPSESGILDRRSLRQRHQLYSCG